MRSYKYGLAGDSELPLYFKEYPNFSAVTTKFEDFVCDTYLCDLIYSASAFHWIPEDMGYKKVYGMLKKGGVFA